MSGPLERPDPRSGQGPASAARRAALVVPCLLLGVAVAVCVVARHGQWWGLGLGMAATAATVVALPGGWWARLPFALGWAGVVAIATPERAEGDLLVRADAQGYVLLFSAMAVFVAGFAGLLRRRPADSRPSNAERAGGAT